MHLFGKKSTKKEGCCSGARIKILGSGCVKCNQLEANTLEALKQLAMDTAIDHVTDFTQIAAYGVMTTPALVVDGKVVSFGKVLKTEDVVELLKKEKEEYALRKRERMYLSEDHL